MNDNLRSKSSTIVIYDSGGKFLVITIVIYKRSLFKKIGHKSVPNLNHTIKDGLEVHKQLSSY